ncbi:hypothetical protein [Vulgatibacter sp.]|uniref:hypothetical protein n=1 Tax=Vulgatibacter sp. TaxID=1971226 RepID=UPI003566DE24
MPRPFGLVLAAVLFVAPTAGASGLDGLADKARGKAGEVLDDAADRTLDGAADRAAEELGLKSKKKATKKKRKKPASSTAATAETTTAPLEATPAKAESGETTATPTKAPRPK